MSFQTFEFSSQQLEYGESLIEGITLQEGDGRDSDSASASASIRRFQKNQSSFSSHKKENPIVNCFVAVFAFLQNSFRHHRLGFILSIILLGAFFRTFEYEYEKRANYKRKHSSWDVDYTDIHSSLDLELSKIDHWCLDGGDDNCPKCDDPIHPYSRLDSEDWSDTHRLNVQHSEIYFWRRDRYEYKKEPDFDVDVIFMGDGSTEARAGTYMGSPGRPNSHLTEVLAGSKANFDTYFNKKNGGKFNGLALGIDGDTSPNLLWRIQNNEFSDLYPKVWWINIGSNDLFSTRCSEEVTLIGILRVLYECQLTKSRSMIVINSILPIAVKSDLSLERKGIRNEYWYAIQEVNEQLQKFAKKHTGVAFFDATSILTTRQENGDLYMKKEMFMDKFHLSAEGQGALSEAQAHMMEDILRKQEMHDPKYLG